jgi:hypothetical protein
VSSVIDRPEPALSLGWPQALAWRLRRHLLDPMTDPAVEDVVRRLGAVPAQPDGAAEWAVGARRRSGRSGDIAQALADGRIIKSFAFRGASPLLTPQDGGIYLALRSASRMWELPSWQSHYRLTPQDWLRLREAVRDALADGPLTVEELGAAVTRRPAFRHLRDVFADGAGTLIKPLSWQGDMSFGPPRGGRPTFQRLDGNPRWGGIPDLDDAGPRAVQAYLRAYGPATPGHLRYWLGEGLGAGGRRIRSWTDALGDRLATVLLDGQSALMISEDLADLAASSASTALRLLPGYDQWVLGPGTADAHIVPPGRRALVSRQANLVLAGGVVAGTWALRGDQVDVAWFAEVPGPDPAGLADEVGRLSRFHGRPLEWLIQQE